MPTMVSDNFKHIICAYTHLFPSLAMSVGATNVVGANADGEW